MATERILVVDDEEDLLELIRYNLGKEGYQVRCVSSGEMALREVRSQPPDLVLLDLLLPAVDGLSVCRILKGDPETQHIPIMMVTAKTEEADVVTGLEIGADDYITKPFSPRVLLARIRAVLRRKLAPELDDDSSIKVHELVIHPGRHEVLLGGRPVDLTFTEFRLLQFLRASQVGLSRAARLSMPSKAKTIPSPNDRWTCKSRDCARNWETSAAISRRCEG